MVSFLNEGAFDNARFKEEGLVTDLKWVAVFGGGVLDGGLWWRAAAP